jgi:hypothetical protein
VKRRRLYQAPVQIAYTCSIANGVIIHFDDSRVLRLSERSLWNGLAGLSDATGMVEFLSDIAKSPEYWFAVFWPAVSQTHRPCLDFAGVRVEAKDGSWE